MIFVKISQNFIKSPLKFCLISQISVHSLWHVCKGGGSNFQAKAYSHIVVHLLHILFKVFCISKDLSLCEMDTSHETKVRNLIATN